MTAQRLLSIAEIARELDAPESTVHYWKNRYAAFLPSLGQNRQKRFKPEALAAFRTIADMLRQGHAPAEVTAALSSAFAMTPASVATGQPGTIQTLAQATGLEPGPDPVQLGVRIGAEIGAEVARSLAQSMGELLTRFSACLPDPGQARPQALAPAAPGSPPADPSQAEAQAEKLAALESENAQFRSKLEVLEAELIRLRKDRREMEKYLLDKIKGVTT
jgi:DNA-binding transcriptional MerR regulator